MSDLDAELARFKAQPARHNVAVLLTDWNLLNYCVHWTMVPTKVVAVPGVEADWDALWACVEVDYAALALLADQEEVHARKAVQRLKGLRLAYPDGTVQELVQKLLTKKLMDVLA